MLDLVKYDVSEDGQVAVLTLNRPAAKNAFSRDAYRQCTECLHRAEADTRVAVLIITGAGDYFSSGADVKELSRDGAPAAANRSTIASQPAGQFMRAIVRFPKLLVAAVNGPAVGIGVTLLAHCDLVVCTPQATFWTPFSRLAVVPELCSSVTFPALMGQSAATEMLALGRVLTAQEALAARLVSRVLPAQGFVSQVHVVLRESLLSLPFGAESAAYYKRVMLAARLPRLEAALEAEFLQLDERFRRGTPQAALRALSARADNRSGRSRL